MKLDRFLTGILIGIGVIVVIALTLFFMRRGDARYVTEDTPEGVIQNYVLALQKKDFEKAYSYLSESENKPDFSNFREFFMSSFESYNRSGLSFGVSTVIGDSAYVTVIIQRSYGGPFSEISRNNETVNLIRQDGFWKIERFPYPFWGYDWYEDNYKQ